MHILCVSDDPMLLRTRSEILRTRCTVVECTSGTAWQVFVDGDFDAVVLCASIPFPQQVALVRWMSSHSPSLLILRCEEDDLGDVDDAERDVDPAALTAGVGLALAIGVLTELEGAKDAGRAGLRVRLAHAVVPGLQDQLLAAGNLAQRYDLSRVVNTELRAEAVKRAGMQN